MTSSISWLESGGRSAANERINNVLPVPGGPDSKMLCRPAAAIASARFACSWPIMESKVRTGFFRGDALDSMFVVGP